MTTSSLPALVINLASSEDRWARASLQLDALGVRYSRVAAVDGNDISEPDLADLIDRHADRHYGYNLSPPEAGCYLSHARAWTRVADSSRPGAVILEDDFTACPDLVPVMESLLTQDWGNNPVMIRLYEPSPYPFMTGYRLTEKHRLVLPVRIHYGMVGYYINRIAAEVLSERPSRFFRPVDEDLRRDWETGLMVASVAPFPVGYDANVSSLLASPRLWSGRGKVPATLRLNRALDYRVRTSVYSFVRKWRFHHMMRS